MNAKGAAVHARKDLLVENIVGGPVEEKGKKKHKFLKLD
jgi:hypothetical protein